MVVLLQALGNYLTVAVSVELSAVTSLSVREFIGVREITAFNHTHDNLLEPVRELSQATLSGEE